MNSKEINDILSMGANDLAKIINLTLDNMGVYSIAMSGEQVRQLVEKCRQAYVDAWDSQR